MKRSEAVELLTILITELRAIKGLTDHEFADDILTTCEAIGMLPPHVCNEDICCQNVWED